MLESMQIYDVLYCVLRFCRSVSKCEMKFSKCVFGVVLGGGVGDLYTELIVIFLLFISASMVMHSKVFGIIYECCVKCLNWMLLFM